MPIKCNSLISLAAELRTPVVYYLRSLL